MKYSVGMFGGSFDPLHMGHLHDIIRAASMCNVLFIVISWCEERDSTSKELRYRWISNSCKHLGNIKILLLEDDAADKETYNTDDYWEIGAKTIKKMVERPIDVVFCGDDYWGTGRFESLYKPQSEIIYFDRKEVPISSTDIRNWAMKNWDYIPNICRPYYAYKVLIIGGESTGKSTLVQSLAIAYNTNYVGEIGRDISDIAGSENLMIEEDFYEILIKHKAAEIDAIKQSNRILFIDTDALTTKFYVRFLLKSKNELQRSENLAEAISEISNYDLIIFLEPTVPFVQDGTRNNIIASDRKKYSKLIKKIFDEYHLEYHCIKGSFLDRFNKSKMLIKDQLGIW